MKRLKNYFSIVNKYWSFLIISLLFTVILQWGYSYVPLFIAYIVELLEKGFVANSGIPQFLLDLFMSADTLLSTILYVVLSLIGLQLLRFTVMFFEHYLRGYVKEGLSRDLRVRLYNHIQNLSYRYHNNVDTGDLMQRVTSDVDSSTQFISNGLGNAVYILASMIFGAIRLSSVNMMFMFITFAAIPLTAVASVIYFKKIDKINHEVEEAESKMTVVIQENLSGSKVVKAFANEEYEIDKLDKKSVVFRDKVKKINKIAAFYWGGMDVFALVEYLIIVIVGGTLILENSLKGSMMVQVLGLVGMLIWPMRMLGRIVNEFSKALVASDRLFEILKMPTEYEVNGKLKPDIFGEIKFDNVYFKFEDTDEHLLNGISFTIKKGETVALVGKTGSGKSTIINLLLRMYDYSGGSITIDGVELKDIDKGYIRSKIGTVLQEPFLYSKTVYENIAITDKNAPKEAVYEAARIASIEKDISTFKDGYETIVGEKGATLSGGQKQRVAIARVLLDEKPILIFDDALSAVDTKTDIAIRDALKKREEKATNIIITHRITTAKEANRIIVLNEGKVESIGTHSELKEKPGLYKVLWDIQGKLEDEFLRMIEGEKHV